MSPRKYKVRKGSKRPWGMPHTLRNDTRSVRGILPTNCRVWRWGTSNSGRGRIYAGTGGDRAHRIFYEQHHGPIPNGLEIDHLCRNTLCVNPKHLEAVTRAENVWRGDQAKLTRNEVRVLRLYAESCRLRGKNRPEKSLVAAFGLHRTTLQTIIVGKKWKKLV